MTHTPPPLRRSRRLVVAAAVTSLLAVPLTHGSAAAADDHAELAKRYGSLSASMAGMYALEAGQDLGAYLAAQELTLVSPAAGAVLPGVPAPVVPATPTAPSTPTGGEVGTGPAAAGGDLAALDFDSLDIASLSAHGGLILDAQEAASIGGGVTLSGGDIGALNAQLDAAGLTLNTTKFSSLNHLASKVTKAARTADGAVTLAGAKWAQDLADLKVPKLNSPKVGTPSKPGIPADALPFGLLMNKSLTNLVTDYPDLVTASQKNGTGQPKMMQAWQNSMTKAYSSSSANLNSLLPSPCVGTMMSVMATGKAAAGSAGCGSTCLASGKYLHESSKSLFSNNPTVGVTNSASGLLAATSMGSLANWASGTINTNSPTLTSSPFGAFSAGCSETSPAVKKSAATTLPGVFGQLAAKNKK